MSRAETSAPPSPGRPPHLLLLGSGRSGTTWILDALADANELRTIFEPLHPDGLPGAGPFANRYLTSEAEEPSLKRFLENAFSGEYNNVWTNCRILPGRLKPSLRNLFSRDDAVSMFWRYEKWATRSLAFLNKRSRRPMVKLIRANLMLGWLARNFDAKIVFVIRHPGAVVSSKMRRGGLDWDYTGEVQQRLLQQYLNDPALVRDSLSRYRDVSANRLSPVAGHTLIWCIENVLPMMQAKDLGCCLVHYEDVILQPERAFERMVRFFGLERVPDKERLRTPSQQASAEMAQARTGSQQIDRWTKTLSKEELSEMERILKSFGVSSYHVHDPLPLNRDGDLLPEAKTGSQQPWAEGSADA